MAGGPAIADGLGVLTRIEWRSSDAAAVAEAVGIAVPPIGRRLPLARHRRGRGGGHAHRATLPPRFPMALVVMLAGMSLSYVAGLQARGVQVLGPVPAGLGSLGIPFATPTELFALLPRGDRTRDHELRRHRGDRPLLRRKTRRAHRSRPRARGPRRRRRRRRAHRRLPVSSSPSRTSAAEGAGSTSQATGLVAAAGVALVLLLFTTPSHTCRSRSWAGSSSCPSSV